MIVSKEMNWIHPTSQFDYQKHQINNCLQNVPTRRRLNVSARTAAFVAQATEKITKLHESNLDVINIQ